MFSIILILAAGLIGGRLFLKFAGRRASLATASLGYVVWVMLAAFGLRIGADSGIMDRLPTLGLEALLLGTAATLLSGFAVAVAFRRFAPDETTLTDPRHTTFSPRALTGSAVTLFFLAAGIVAGRTGWIPVGTDTAEAWATLLLKLLILLVGISTGSNPELATILRGIRPAIVAIPVIALVATYVAGALTGLLLPIGMPDGALAVSGMGYYSLSSMIISDLRAADMGAAAAMSLAAVALMANIVREVLALVIIPVIGPRLGLYGSTALCGVTSIDVTLPALASTFGAEAIPCALVNGILLEVSTPFTVMGACVAAAALS